MKGWNAVCLCWMWLKVNGPDRRRFGEWHPNLAECVVAANVCHHATLISIWHFAATEMEASRKEFGRSYPNLPGDRCRPPWWRSSSGSTKDRSPSIALPELLCNQAASEIQTTSIISFGMLDQDVALGVTCGTWGSRPLRRSETCLAMLCSRVNTESESGVNPAKRKTTATSPSVTQAWQCCAARASSDVLPLPSDPQMISGCRSLLVRYLCSVTNIIYHFMFHFYKTTAIHERIFAVLKKNLQKSRMVHTTWNKYQ